MIGFDLDPVELELATPPVVFGRGLVSAEPGVWTMLLVQRDGTIDHVFTENLKNLSIQEREGLPAQMGFNMPISGTELDIVKREIQLYEGSDLVFHGPLLQRSADSEQESDPYTAYGLEWYLSRRFYAAGYVPRYRIPLREDGIGRTSMMDGQNFLLDIEIKINMPSSYTGEPPRLEAWVDNYEIGVGVTDVDDEPGYTYGEAVVYPDSFPRDKDIIVKVTLFVKLRGIVYIEAHFYDFGVLDIVEPLKAWITPMGGSDDAPIPLAVSDLVRRSVGGLNLGYRQIGAGEPMVLMPPPDQHLDETLNQGLPTELWQWGVESTGATRTVTVWTHAHPRGQVWEEDDLHLWTDGRQGTIRKYSLSEDGTKARSRLTLKNEQGVRGTATNLAAWDGLGLEDSQEAPAGTRNELLQLTAYNLLRKDPGQVRNLQVTVSATLRPTLKLYDKIRVDIDHGTRQIHGRHRVVGRTITPGAPFMVLELTKDEP
jgi:hypothetical protein